MTGCAHETTAPAEGIGDEIRRPVALSFVMMHERPTHPDSTTTADVLARVPLFEKLSARQLKKLARLCVPRSHEANEVLIEEGTIGLGMFVVRSGRVVVYRGQADNRLKVAELGEGEVLGEMALIDDQPRSGTVIALEPSRSLLITREGFRSLMKSSPEIAWCIVPVLVVRIRELLERLERSSTRQAGQQAGTAVSDVVATRPPGQKASSEADSPRPTARPVAPAQTTRSEGRASGFESANPVLQAMRLQYQVLSATLTGMGRVVAASHDVLDKVAREANLDKKGGLDLMSPFRVIDWLGGDGRSGKR